MLPNLCKAVARQGAGLLALFLGRPADGVRGREHDLQRRHRRRRGHDRRCRQRRHEPRTARDRRAQRVADSGGLRARLHHRCPDRRVVARHGADGRTGRHRTLRLRRRVQPREPGLPALLDRRGDARPPRPHPDRRTGHGHGRVGERVGRRCVPTPRRHGPINASWTLRQVGRGRRRGGSQPPHVDGSDGRAPGRYPGRRRSTATTTRARRRTRWRACRPSPSRGSDDQRGCAASRRAGPSPVGRVPDDLPPRSPRGPPTRCRGPTQSSATTSSTAR